MSSVADIRSTSPRRAIGWSSAIPTRIRSAVIIHITPRDLATYVEPVEDEALSRPGVIHLRDRVPTFDGDLVGTTLTRVGGRPCPPEGGRPAYPCNWRGCAATVNLRSRKGAAMRV